MKIWIDDIRPAPSEEYVWRKSVNDAKFLIEASYEYDVSIEVIDIDHDAGDYATYGGDYIRLLDWLEEKGYNIPIHIHSMNVVGRMNMEAICRRNGWKIVE